MDSLIGLISASILFLFISGIIYFLIKKNMFSSGSGDVTDKRGNLNDKRGSKIAKLRKENDDLNKEIKFLEGKNKRLRLKIEKMKQVIKELQEQKLQLEKNEKRLNELRVRKDETLAMVAHDLKNPASTIKNFVQLLESYDLSIQEQQDVFLGLMETSSRLVSLAEEFSQVMSEEYLPFNMNKTKSDIKELVDSIVKINRIKAGEKNIEIRLYQPEDLLELNLDQDKIKEVVDNFVGNAIKFCPENSLVEVNTKVSNKDIIIEVSDNGYGLTEEEISHAFEKGIKLSTKPTAGESSSGLGLWIAKRIIEEHDGHVYVKSKKGFGSTFAFTLPIKSNS